jgi:hypothetical protein
VVVCDPRGAGLHGEVEWVDLPSVQTFLDTLVSTARTFRG